MEEMHFVFLPGTGIPLGFYEPLLSQLSSFGPVHCFNYRHKLSMATHQQAYQSGGIFADHYFALRSEVCFGASTDSRVRIGLEDEDSILAWYRQLMGLEVDGPISLETSLRQTVFVGHSQGAGHALLIAQCFNVAGVLLLAGPADAVDQQPSGWTQLPFRTPKSRILLLFHGADGAARMILRHGNALGLELMDRGDTHHIALGGKAIMDNSTDAGLVAHGYCAGPKVWGGGTSSNGFYTSILASFLAEVE